MSSIEIPVRFGPKGERPKALIVLLHGYGGDAQDMLPTARALFAAFPKAAVRCLQSTEPCEIWPEGRQWFPAVEFDAKEMWFGVQAAAPAIHQCINDLLEELELFEEHLILAGFSQGAMVALHVGTRRPRPCRGLISFSGALAGPDYLQSPEVVRSPVFLVHGEKDTVLNPSYTLAAASQLGAAGFEVETHLLPNMDHAIDGKAQSEAIRFIQGLGQGL